MIYPNNYENKIGFNEIRTLLSNLCLSTLGKERVEQIAFSTNADDINEMMEQVREFRRIEEKEEDMPLQYFFDMREPLTRIRLIGTHLEEEELFDLRRSMETANGIVRFLNRTNDECR
jgi:DNA mismatch repair protein MutS2